MYVKLPSGDLNSSPCPPTPHTHLYLWSDHRAKGARWYYSATWTKVHMDNFLEWWVCLLWRLEWVTI